MGAEYDDQFKERLLALCEEYGVDDATIIVGEGGDSSMWREVELPVSCVPEMLRCSREALGALVGAKVRLVTTLKDGDGEAKLALGFKGGHVILFVRSSSGKLRSIFRGGMALFADEILERRRPHEKCAAAIAVLRDLVGIVRKEETQRSGHGRKPIRVIARQSKETTSPHHDADGQQSHPETDLGGPMANQAGGKNE